MLISELIAHLKEVKVEYGDGDLRVQFEKQKELTMTISELITYLEEAQAEYGNIEVRVQYRGNEDYEGEDEYLYCETVTEGDKAYFIL